MELPQFIHDEADELEETKLELAQTKAELAIALAKLEAKRKVIERLQRQRDSAIQRARVARLR